MSNNSWRRATAVGPYASQNFVAPPVHATINAGLYAQMSHVAEDQRRQEALLHASRVSEDAARAARVMEHDLSATRVRLDTAAQDADAALRSNRHLRQEVTELRAELEVATSEKRALRRQVDDLMLRSESDASAGRHDRSIILEENRSTKEELVRLQQQMVEHARDKFIHERTIADLHAEIQRNNRTLVDQNDTIRTLTGEMSRRHPAHAIRHHREVMASLHPGGVPLESVATIQELSTKLAAALAERDRALRDVQVLQADLAAANARAAASATDGTAAQAIDSLNQKLRRAADENNRLSKQLAQGAAAPEAVPSAERDAYERRIRFLESENCGLKAAATKRPERPESNAQATAPRAEAAADPSLRRDKDQGSPAPTTVVAEKRPPVVTGNAAASPIPAAAKIPTPPPQVSKPVPAALAEVVSIPADVEVLVYVQSCSGLLSRDVLGNSDPFVIVHHYLADEKDPAQRATLKRTPVVDGSQDPTWPLDKGSCRVKIPAGPLISTLAPQAASKSLCFSFEVWDCDVTGNDFLGVATIPVVDVVNGPNGPRTLPLKPRDKENDPEIIEKASKLGFVTVDFTKINASSPGASMLLNQPTREQLSSALKAPPQEVLVHVSGCSNLLDRDAIGGKSDPFVIVYDSTKKEIKRTPVVDDTLNPTWDVDKASVKTIVDPKSDTGNLLFEVWDCDVTSNDFLGCAQISVTELIAAGSGRRVLSLRPREKESDSTIVKSADKLGLITIEVTLLNAASQLPTSQGKPAAPPAPISNKVYDVQVHIAGCQGLLDRDTFGGHSDPFVIMYHTDGKTIVKKTPVADDTASPVWDEDKGTARFQLGGADLSGTGPDKHVTFEVWDHDVTTNDFLGVARVNVRDLVVGGFGPMVVPLGPREKENEKIIIENAGKLGSIKLKFSDVTALPAATSTATAASGGRAPPPPQEAAPASLLVHVAGCKGLLDRDAIGGHSDPYVIVYDHNNKEVKRTPVIDDCANPTWTVDKASVKYTLPSGGASGSMRFEVWDSDVTSSDFLGCVAVSLQDMQQILAAGGATRELQLVPRDKEPDSDIVKYKSKLGTITIDFSCLDGRARTNAIVAERPHMPSAAGAGASVSLPAAASAAGASKPLPDVARKVRVWVSGCDGLLDRDTFGGESDPFVIVSEGLTKQELKRTPVIDDAKAPRWTSDKASFLHIASRSAVSDNVSANHYCFEVWDSDVTTNDFLGYAELPVETAVRGLADGGQQQFTLQLGPRPKENDPKIIERRPGELGTITIVISDANPAAPAPVVAAPVTSVEPVAVPRPSPASAPTAASAAPVAAAPAVAPAPAPVPSAPVSLRIYVAGMDDIIDADGFGTGTSDPKVTVFGPSGKRLLETPEVQNCLKPRWSSADASGVLEVDPKAANGAAMITFKAEDVDLVGTDFLGEARVSVQDAMNSVGKGPMVVRLAHPKYANAGTITIHFAL